MLMLDTDFLRRRHNKTYCYDSRRYDILLLRRTTCYIYRYADVILRL